MRRNLCSLTWKGAPYCFARMRDVAAPARGATAEWAVARGGEFIGTMPCAADITTGEFEVRCMCWLTELLG
jgi:hypothetical protein